MEGVNNTQTRVNVVYGCPLFNDHIQATLFGYYDNGSRTGGDIEPLSLSSQKINLFLHFLQIFSEVSSMSSLDA